MRRSPKLRKSKKAPEIFRRLQYILLSNPIRLSEETISRHLKNGGVSPYKAGGMRRTAAPSDRKVAQTVENGMENTVHPNFTFKKLLRLPLENAEVQTEVNLNFS
jgi:hypothetical protein